MTPVLLREALLDALALILPTECVCCSSPDRALCAPCAAGLRPPPVTELCISSDPPLSVWSALTYDGVVKTALSAFKESGRTDVSPHLAATLTQSVQDARLAIDPLLAPGVPLALVPAPSSRRAYRSRGYRPVDLLARAVARSMTGDTLHRARLAGVAPPGGASPVGAAPLHVLPALVVAGSTRDQAGLGVDDRQRNLTGAVTIRHGFSGDRMRGRQVLLIDDVVTTGATLLACRAALEGAGATVWGAATLAHTVRHVGRSRVEVVGPVQRSRSGGSDDRPRGEDYGGLKGAEELALTPGRRVFSD